MSPTTETLSKSIPEETIHAPFTARWITHSSAIENPVGVYLFRTTLSLDKLPDTHPVRVSADNRYELTVNGNVISRGPGRGDLANWCYETVDLAPFLKTGENVIAATVWWLDITLAPIAQIGLRPAFLFDAPQTPELNTPGDWLTLRHEGYRFVPVDRPAMLWQYFVVGPGEELHAEKAPRNWQLPDPNFDSSEWEKPFTLDRASVRGARDSHSPWQLVANFLPPMENTPQPVPKVRRITVNEWEPQEVEGLLTAEMPLIAAANSKSVILLDNEVLTIGYPELRVSGGTGAKVSMRYAEALMDGEKGDSKGNRDEIEGKILRGNPDTLLCNGEETRFRPLWWRTLRYLQIEIETGDEPLTLYGVTNYYCAYPFEERGKFQCSDPTIQELWDVGWRTARLCAFETYMDCPYYEQLQYVGDARIQAMISYYVGGDPRLAKNALALMDASRTPDGLTQSRYPSSLVQMIPPFSLWFVGMIYDYWKHVDDRAFVRSLLPGARGVVEWFLRHRREDGLLGALPWWNFLDWKSEFPNSGDAPGATEGGSAALTLQLALALQELSLMERELGDNEEGIRHENLVSEMFASVVKTCYSSERHLFADTPEKQSFSRHTTILALLLSEDEIPPMDTKAMIHSFQTDATLLSTTFYFRYYEHTALRYAEAMPDYLALLDDWRKMLETGLTTWAETPEPSRSDCHAWSAHPNVNLLRYVLGVRSFSSRFEMVNIEPNLGSLEWAEGTVPHPKGDIRVRLERSGNSRIAEITFPEDTEGFLDWEGLREQLKPGHQRFETTV